MPRGRPGEGGWNTQVTDGGILSKKLIFAAAVLVAAQVLSGCYSLREFTWSDDRVEPNGGTRATVSLTPVDDGDDGHFFIRITGIADVSTKFLRPVFDSRNQIGQRQSMVRDSVLASEAGDDGCQGISSVRGGGGSSAFFETAFRTEDPVSDATRKFIQATFNSRVGQDAAGGFLGVVETGIWRDEDSDGVPEADNDTITCSGGSSTSYVVKGSATSRDVVEELQRMFAR